MYIMPVSYQPIYWPESSQSEQKNSQSQINNQNSNIEDKVTLDNQVIVTVNLYGADGKLKEIIK